MIKQQFISKIQYGFKVPYKNVAANYTKTWRLLVLIYSVWLPLNIQTSDEGCNAEPYWHRLHVTLSIGQCWLSKKYLLNPHIPECPEKLQFVTKNSISQWLYVLQNV